MTCGHISSVIVMALTSILLAIVTADHCPPNSKPVPNATSPNHPSEPTKKDTSCQPEKKCSDPNKVYLECASICPRTCNNWWETIRCDGCAPGCACKDDLVLNDQDQCVSIDKCPKPVCSDPNREFTEYGSACPESCPGINDNKTCTLQFVPGCFCKAGLVEDGKGNCIDPECCPDPVCPDPNREYKQCGTACPRTCKNKDWDIIGCTRQCVSGCFCKEGLVEDGNNNCIDPNHCPPPECLDPNQEYLECGTACPKTCDNYNKNITCTEQCVSGCFCKKGLVEDGNKCVKPKHCHKCKDPRTYFTECGSACPKTCKNYYKYDEIICTKQCVKGCVCRDEYVLDKKGKCINPYDCPPPVCDDKNRVFNSCGSSCPDSCKNINQPDRVCTTQCVSNCFCKYPLVEDGNGNCIERKKCPNPTCKDPKRYYKECGTGCPLSCKNRCKDFSCAAVCVKGCFCLPWLIDDGNGKCISPSECPKDACKCEGNSVWKDCGYCDGSCQTPNPICPKECKPGCYCPEGYVRDNRNVCIKKSNCPKEN